LVSLLGAAGLTTTAAAATRWVYGIVIAISVALLARSFYFVYVKRTGTRATAIITWGATIFVAVFWTVRLTSL
jgi:hypothetical protein